MRDYVYFYINGEPHQVKGEKAFMQMSDYLRYVRGMTGTKIVCAEGDCGACSIMKAFPKSEDQLKFYAVNSCVAPVYLFDSCHVVTVEGLRQNEELHPIQEAMVNSNGAQCGFCTPGFVVALANMFEHKEVSSENPVTEKSVKNYLTGNLCRCTGYQDIVKAALQVKPEALTKLQERYYNKDAVKKCLELQNESVFIESEEYSLRIPVSLAEAEDLLDQAKDARIVSGATDLGVQINKEKIDLKKIISFQLVSELYNLEEKGEAYHVGAKVNLHELQGFMETRIPEFAEFLNIFASPQIKNKATLVGNIANASPIADTTPCLMALDAKLEIRGKDHRRDVELVDFYKGYKDLDLKPGEFISKLIIPKPPQNRFFRNYKVSQRRDLDISAINASFLAEKDGDKIKNLRVSYGGVGPVTLRLRKTEIELKGKDLSTANVDSVKKTLLAEITPISDARGTAAFRNLMALSLLDKYRHEWADQ